MCVYRYFWANPTECPRFFPLLFFNWSFISLFACVPCLTILTFLCWTCLSWRHLTFLFPPLIWYFLHSFSLWWLPCLLCLDFLLSKVVLFFVLSLFCFYEQLVIMFVALFIRIITLKGYFLPVLFFTILRCGVMFYSEDLRLMVLGMSPISFLFSVHFSLPFSESFSCPKTTTSFSTPGRFAVLDVYEFCLGRAC